MVTLEDLTAALKEDLPVVFVYIGWAKLYAGTEPVVGNHRYLKDHPNDCEEAEAFVQSDQNGVFTCGIGRGGGPERAHIVLVALDPTSNLRKIVGVYAAADIDARADGSWADAHTAHAICIPIDRRPDITKDWRTGQSQRRWVDKHPQLQRVFERLKVDLPRIVSCGTDQTFSGITALEGQSRKLLVRHRKREAKLRLAKIAIALKANKGRLVCEVPRCGFDFLLVYGDIGRGYAHVHHLRPLAGMDELGEATSLEDLALVCANCHSMIHNGGHCRDLATLIPE